MNRRAFLASATAAGCAAAMVQSAAGAVEEDSTGFPLVEAKHFKKLDELKVECTLCPRKCRVADLERGYCGVRENRDGTYYTLVHSRACSMNIDPIEKKPLFHFMPGTNAFSIATAGCNMECLFCQNWQISQFRPEQVDAHMLTPEMCAEVAVSRECSSIAYTYSEPVVFFEYMYDCAVAGRKKGVRSVMISNGYIQKEPMEELCGVLDAVKIDFKAFTEKFYSETCHGKLAPVLDTLKLLKEKKMWFELVMLVVPTLNDDRDEFTKMCRWIVEELGPDVPVHFTRFHPTYKLRNLPPTPVKTLEIAHAIAKTEGIRFPYLGNVWGHPAEHTYCPDCKTILIRRLGNSIKEIKIEDGKCSSCATPIPGVWS
jgi:pyruvate formate lyase activating enzyme